MKTNPKKCKGTGRAAGHGCGALQLERVYGLGVRCGCYRDWLLNTPEGHAKMERALIRTVKKSDDRKRKKKKSEKIELGYYKPKLQNKINEIVRLIDIGQPCLAKRIHARQMHAGHVYSRGQEPHMKYNLHNIHRQSAQSNHWQSDDHLMREGLMREYGERYSMFVSDLRKVRTILSLSNKDYYDLYRKASKIALELIKAGKTYDTEQRIELRNRVNSLLDIYTESENVFKK